MWTVYDSFKIHFNFLYYQFSILSPYLESYSVLPWLIVMEAVNLIPSKVIKFRIDKIEN